jgi:hypothetical protein
MDRHTFSLGDSIVAHPSECDEPIGFDSVTLREGRVYTIYAIDTDGAFVQLAGIHSTWWFSINRFMPANKMLLDFSGVRLPLTW